MKIRKFIAQTTLLSFLISASAAQAWISFAPDKPAESTKSHRPFELNRKAVVVAQNDPQATEDDKRSTNENSDRTSASGIEKNEKSDKNDDEAGTKPLKPFKPSEEIAAEQAVDYPVDI